MDAVLPEVVARLEALAIPVARWAGPAGEVVRGRVRGRSPDRVLLVARASGDAGAATLLELARVLGRRRSSHTVDLVWVAPARGLGSGGGGLTGAAPGSAVADLALGAEGRDGLRAVLVLHPPATAGRVIARDLRSHPILRDLLWAAAARRGRTEYLLASAGWETPAGLHASFLAAGIAPVAVVAPAATWPPPVAAAGVSPGDFEAVGPVVLDGLTALMRRFERVDAFRVPGP